MLRKAQPRDADIIYGMLCTLEGETLHRDAFQEIFLRNIQQQDNLYLVCTQEDDTVVGYLSLHTQWLLHHVGLVAEIQEMFVQESHRSEGLGKALVHEAREWAMARGCVLMEVTANRVRERTHEFYVAQGFQATHLKFTQALG
jgi:(aminoalkyl)phosphonate N-acetyltransferase